jgi:hypothetical protein
MYLAPLQRYLNRERVYTYVWVDLETAKALKQIEVNSIRLKEHRRQVPLRWERHHSHDKVFWVGYIGKKVYTTMTKN